MSSPSVMLPGAADPPPLPRSLGGRSTTPPKLARTPTETFKQYTTRGVTTRTSLTAKKGDWALERWVGGGGVILMFLND